MTVYLADDVHWIRESDLVELDNFFLTGNGSRACLMTANGNSWYGYYVSNFFHCREFDVNRDLVWNDFSSGALEQFYSMKETSGGYVVVWESQANRVKRYTSGGPTFAGDWSYDFSSWGSSAMSDGSLFVDQTDSDKIYVCANGFGCVSLAGSVLHDKAIPSKERMHLVGKWDGAGKIMAITRKGDGGNVYMWDPTADELICVKDLEGPDDDYNLHSIATVPGTIEWNFSVSERLDQHSVDDAGDSVGTTTWIAQTFTLADYKKPGRVTLNISRQHTNGTVTVSIQAVDGEGKPDGVDICVGTFTAVNAGIDSTRYASHVFFTTTPILVPGTYALVVRANEDSMVLGTDSAGGHSGQMWDSADGGSSWVPNSNSLTFDLWGDVSGCTAPSFDAQSGNQSLYVDQTPTTLSVTVSGNPTPTLQWYANGSPIIGETGSTYSPPAQSSPTSISYTCRATNLLGYTDTAPMVITWSEEPPPADPVTYRILNLQLDLNRT
jgi:hypothetical protein